MASKRLPRNKVAKQKQYNTLTISDVLCPICRSIFVEPVTLPCNHGFCYSCFEGTMQNANLVCPLCRIRIGSWLRKTKKEGKLINNELWKTVKLKFAQQIKNKLMGIDENFDEESEIIVSYPGEIRKEYEIQKQKEESEVRKKREADIKASEDLIKKIKKEEEYQKAVIEEKIKFDEQVAKKLAGELCLSAPSTSKDKVTEKCGPLDKYLKKDNETVTSQNVNRKQFNFSKKEYTCRVLCLDNNDNKNNKKVFSPSVKKKIQQIQKFVDLDTTSDGSDCIESEMRYFKPIDHRLNPPSQGKTPIKIPSKRALQNINSQIVSPSGMINFHSNHLESAFARIFGDPSTVLIKTNPVMPITSPLKRTHSNEDSSHSKRKAVIEDNNKGSPKLNNASILKKQILPQVANQCESSSSPPFYGFENTDSKKNPNKVIPINNSKVNGVFKTNEEHTKKLLQEKADLEFARKLQDEFNRAAYKRSTRRTSIFPSRQATLEEMMSPRHVK